MDKLNRMELSSWLGFELGDEMCSSGSFNQVLMNQVLMNQVLMNLALIPYEIFKENLNSIFSGCVCV